MTCAMPLIWISVSVTINLPATGQPLGRGRFLPSERFESDDYVSGKGPFAYPASNFLPWPRRLNMRRHRALARRLVAVRRRAVLMVAEAERNFLASYHCFRRINSPRRDSNMI